MSLEDFQNIKITLTEKVMSSRADLPMCFPDSITKRITVHSMYFINTDTAQKFYKDEREKSDFNDIINSLKQQNCKSLIMTAPGSPYSCGRAVQYGKSTPSDIKAFIEVAFSKGIIESYAIRKNLIKKGQKLVFLAETDIQNIVQNWMKDTGVGVDCSGFVQQAAIEARDSERKKALITNEILKAAGSQNFVPVPSELSKIERSAASYLKGPRVEHPSELTPGVVWVIKSGNFWHIRRVTAVRNVTLGNGTETIEFETEESAGGSTRSEPGPTKRTWRTNNTKKYDPIIRVDVSGSSATGSFHKIP
jgi:hypothetical protein